MKHKGMKILAMLLTLAMLVGLMPGMGMTAYAASTTVTWYANDISGSGYVDSFTKDNITITGDLDCDNKYIYGPGEFTTASGKFTKIEVTADGFGIDGTGWSGGTWTGDASSSVSYDGYIMDYGSGNLIVFTIETADATHSVTITPGSNMTKTTTSGAESQTGVTGAITDVVYTANDGYYFPEDYAVTAVNGISVTRNSYTQITVSGTPTADATITLTAPTAKTTPAAPTTAAAVGCTTSYNNDGKLTGVTTAMEYKKSDATDWIAGTGSDITGLVPGTYYVRLKATDTTTASDNQELTIAGYVASNYTVTYKVVNGTWSDDSTADKTETVQSGSKPASVPTGMKASNGYTSGAWDKNPADATITEATTFTYIFTATPTFNVTVSETPNGTVTASKTTATAGENITLTITPASGYQIQATTVTDVNSNNISVTNNSFTMPAADVTVTVTFIQIPVSTYTVTVANTPNGTVTASKTTAAAGENITLTITPASGYQVQAITVTDVNNNNISVTNNSFTMPAANVIVTVTFIESPVQPTTYTVSFFANGGGGVMNPVTVPANTIYTLPACGFTPPAGKQFKAWQLGSMEFAPGDTIKVDSNAEFVALWKDDDGSGESGHGGSSGDIVFIGGFGGAEESWEYVGGQQRAWKVSLAPMVNGSAALGIMTGESTTTDMNVYPTTTIYVFPNANPGFVLDKIIWSYIDGSASYDITEAKNFVMPAMDVVVYVTFKPLGS